MDLSTSVNDGRVRMLAVATALPPHELRQSDVLANAREVLASRFAQFDRLASAFGNAGIETRRSVVSMDWFHTPRGWIERTEAYLDGATELFCDAASAGLRRANLAASAVDVIVTVSSTGVATPTLEARAATRLGFRPDVLRVPVFGLGCAGGVSGLAIARDLSAARPGAVVLLVAVETCTLLFRTDRLSKADIIATALFGDGAAAVVLRAGDPADRDHLVADRGRQHMWPDTLAIMGWQVEETGLGVIFDRSIPAFAEAELRAVLPHVLPDRDGDMRPVCHPGGAKVVDALEISLDLPAGTLTAERAVLRDAGNMSAPTVFFVLDRVLRDGEGQVDLGLLALGPGFTVSALALRTPR